MQGRRFFGVCKDKEFMFLARVVFKDNRDNRDNYFLAYFKHIFSVRKLKIVPIVSIVFKTTARRNARMNNKTKAYCLNKNSKKAHKSGFIYEP